MHIVVRQMGGLGNQLFQYAAGMYYGKRYGCRLTIAADPDRHAHSQGSPRPFLLGEFRLSVRARPAHLAEEFLVSRNPRVKRASAVARALFGTLLVVEPEEHRFFPDLPFERRPRVVFLRAYWQAAAYAAAVEAELRRDLTLKNAPAGKNLEVLRRIERSACPVSVHIRRGDYVYGPHNLTLSLTYYREAMRRIKEQFPHAELFVFSDDCGFAREHLAPNLPAVYVDHNNLFTGHEDLRLMAACRHHIIANSSFSWWGAWLNPNREKLVIAPKHWRGNTPSYYPELFPDGWQIIDNLVTSDDGL
jgi:hypothetical protein